MKKFYSTILLTMLLCMFCPKAFAHDIAVENDDGVMIYYNYINDGTELEVTYRGTEYSQAYSGDIVIPKEVTYMGITRKVTRIGSDAFYKCTSLTSVEIPNSVTRIEMLAFSSCSSLTSVTIGNSVTSIEFEAFSACGSLTSVHISDLEAWCKISFEKDTSNPLYYAHHLYLNDTEIIDLIIPNSVTSIGDYAFYNCSSLTSVEIPNSVTSIGQSTFYGHGEVTHSIKNQHLTGGAHSFACFLLHKKPPQRDGGFFISSSLLRLSPAGQSPELLHR